MINPFFRALFDKAFMRQVLDIYISFPTPSDLR